MYFIFFEKIVKKITRRKKMKTSNKKAGAILLCLVIGFLATKSTDLQSVLFHGTVM